jgi:hypothetical protein
MDGFAHKWDKQPKIFYWLAAGSNVLYRHIHRFSTNTWHCPFLMSHNVTGHDYRHTYCVYLTSLLCYQSGDVDLQILYQNSWIFACYCTQHILGNVSFSNQGPPSSSRFIYNCLDLGPAPFPSHSRSSLSEQVSVNNIELLVYNIFTNECSRERSV